MPSEPVGTISAEHLDEFPLQASQPVDPACLDSWKIFGSLDHRPDECTAAPVESQGVLTYPKTDRQEAVMLLPRSAADKLRESNTKQVAELWELRTTLQRSRIRIHKYQCLETRLAAARARVSESFTSLETGTSTVQAVSEMNSKKLQRVKGVTRDLGLKCKLASTRLSSLLAAQPKRFQKQVSLAGPKELSGYVRFIEAVEMLRIAITN